MPLFGGAFLSGGPMAESGNEYDQIEKAHQAMMAKKGTEKKSTKMGEQRRYRYGVGRRVRKARSA